MASVGVCLVLGSLMLAGMGLVSYQYGTPAADLVFLGFLFGYIPVLNMAMLRSRKPPSTRPPVPKLRTLRMLFPITGTVSLLSPIALLLGCPKLGSTGLARHTWLMFAQLLFETVAHAFARRAPVAVLPRLAATVGTIAYRIPVAWSWATAAVVPGVSPNLFAVSRGLAVANMLYWGIGILWFLIGVCIPFHISDPTREMRDPSSEDSKVQ